MPSHQTPRPRAALLSSPLRRLAAVGLLAAIAGGPGVVRAGDDPGQAGDGTKAPAETRKLEMPELTKGQLPEKTRTAPDPKTTQYTRGAVSIAVVEEVRPVQGGSFSPPVNVVGTYLEEYLRRAGFDVRPADGAGVDYRLRGRVIVDYDEALTFRDEIIGWRYRGTARLTLEDPKGKALEELKVPEVFRTSSKDEKTAILDVRRLVAKRLHDLLFVQGRVFARREVVRLLATLTVEPDDVAEPLTAEEVIARIADRGLEGVPYLLEAMTDTRMVLAESDYPGLEDPADLRVYHIADKALEEIFQKVSRLPLRAAPAHRYVVTLGWENEWRRFCPPFRDSPHHRRRLERRAAAARARKEAERKDAGSPDKEGG